MNKVATRKDAHKLYLPVTQQILHGEGEENGDCLRAAVASLLCLSIDQVPHFLSKDNENREDHWWDLMSRWLHARGLTMVNVPYREDWVSDWLRNAYYLLAGPSPRFPKELHQVVARGTEVVHDPHPDRTGILPPNKYHDWHVTLFVPLVPGRSVFFPGSLACLVTDEEAGHE